MRCSKMCKTVDSSAMCLLECTSKNPLSKAPLVRAHVAHLKLCTQTLRVFLFFSWFGFFCRDEGRSERDPRPPRVPTRGYDCVCDF